MTDETSILGIITQDNSEFKKKTRRWLSGHFEKDVPECVLFDLEPVTDIPIRLAVEEGAIRNKRDLQIFKTTEEWRDFAKGTVIIAQLLEEGAPYALFVGDGRKLTAIEKKILTQSEDSEQSTTSGVEPASGAAPQRVSSIDLKRKRRLRARLGRLGVKRTSPPSRKRAETLRIVEWKAASEQRILARRRQKRSKK